jgi:dTDP-4-amino-4,6-dideoxygalactose transaminase
VIPFNRANLEGRELEYLQQAIDGGHISGGGPFTRAVEEHLEQLHQGARTLLTTSCTHALEMASLLAGLGPGDEVIVPSYTFVSSASAFLIHQAVPVFVDVDPDTLNLDLDAVTRAIGPRTKAVCAVHYGGVGARPDELARLCEDHDLTLIEDNAHGLFGRFRGEPLGTFGSISTLSFHETKNITCGEGGALVLNDPVLVERAEILRDKGTDRSRFLRGQVDKYTWVDVGSSWVLSDMLAAVLLGQLERTDTTQASRQRIWTAYAQHLATWGQRHGIRLPVIPDEATHPAHLYHLRLRSREERDRFIRSLKARGVSAVFHYQALHLSPVGRKLGGYAGQCPVSEEASETLVRLPLHSGMSDDDVAQVVEAVVRFAP